MHRQVLLLDAEICIAKYGCFDNDAIYISHIVLLDQVSPNTTYQWEEELAKIDSFPFESDVIAISI